MTWEAPIQEQYNSCINQNFQNPIIPISQKQLVPMLGGPWWRKFSPKIQVFFLIEVIWITTVFVSLFYTCNATTSPLPLLEYQKPSIVAWGPLLRLPSPKPHSSLTDFCIFVNASSHSVSLNHSSWLYIVI